MGLFSKKEKPPVPVKPPAITLALEEVPGDLGDREAALLRSLAPIVSSESTFGDDELKASRAAVAHYLPEGPLLTAVLMRSASSLIDAMRADRYEFDDVDRLMGVTGPQLAAAGYKKYEFGYTAMPVDKVKTTLGQIAQGQLGFLQTIDSKPADYFDLVATIEVIEAKLRRAGAV